MGQIETNSTMKLMNYFMPVMIFFMAISLSSGIAIYWVVSNAFQVVQTLMINNPFKIKKERQEKERAEKARQRALEKAMSPKKKRNKKR
jgi:YidC/Oxa1 family membrane protein insertase